MVTTKASVKITEKYFGSRTERSFASNIGLPPLQFLCIFRLPLRHKLCVKCLLLLQEAIIKFLCFLFHKRFLGFNQLCSCSIRSDDKLTVFTLAQYGIPNMKSSCL